MLSDQSHKSVIWNRKSMFELILFPQLKDELVLNGQQSDSGYYQCVAENEVGMDVATAYIQFNRKRKLRTIR